MGPFTPAVITEASITTSWNINILHLWLIPPLHHFMRRSWPKWNLITPTILSAFGRATSGRQCLTPPLVISSITWCLLVWQTPHLYFKPLLTDLGNATFTWKLNGSEIIGFNNCSPHVQNVTNKCPRLNEDNQMVVFAIFSVGKGWGAEDECSTKTVILQFILNHSIPCKMVQEALFSSCFVVKQETKNNTFKKLSMDSLGYPRKKKALLISPYKMLNGKKRCSTLHNKTLTSLYHTSVPWVPYLLT